MVGTGVNPFPFDLSQMDSVICVDQDHGRTLGVSVGQSKKGLVEIIYKDLGKAGGNHKEFVALPSS